MQDVFVTYSVSTSHVIHDDFDVQILCTYVVYHLCYVLQCGLFFVFYIIYPYSLVNTSAVTCQRKNEVGQPLKITNTFYSIMVQMYVSVIFYFHFFYLFTRTCSERKGTMCFFKCKEKNTNKYGSITDFKESNIF